MSGGVATYTTSSIPIDHNYFEACYGGGANNYPSCSQLDLQIVIADEGATIAPVPTLGEWALVVLAMLAMAAGAIVFARRS